MFLLAPQAVKVIYPSDRQKKNGQSTDAGWNHGAFLMLVTTIRASLTLLLNCSKKTGFRSDVVGC